MDANMTPEESNPIKAAFAGARDRKSRHKGSNPVPPRKCRTPSADKNQLGFVAEEENYEDILVSEAESDHADLNPDVEEHPIRDYYEDILDRVTQQAIMESFNPLQTCDNWWQVQ